MTCQNGQNHDAFTLPQNIPPASYASLLSPTASSDPIIDPLTSRSVATLICAGPITLVSNSD